MWVDVGVDIERLVCLRYWKSGGPINIDEDPPTKIFKLDNFDVDVSGSGVEVEVDVDLDVEEMTFQRFLLLCI